MFYDIKVNFTYVLLIKKAISVLLYYTYTREVYHEWKHDKWHCSQKISKQAHRVDVSAVRAKLDCNKHCHAGNYRHYIIRIIYCEIL